MKPPRYLSCALSRNPLHQINIDHRFYSLFRAEVKEPFCFVDSDESVLEWSLIFEWSVWGEKCFSIDQGLLLSNRSRQRSMISAGFQLASSSSNSPFEQYSSKLPASVRGALNHTTGEIPSVNCLHTFSPLSDRHFIAQCSVLSQWLLLARLWSNRLCLARLQFQPFDGKFVRPDVWS